MRNRSLGFSLIELMVAIGVLVVLLAVGVPNFRDFTRNARMAGVANDFIGHTNLARTEAIKRRATVSICSGEDDGTPACDGGNFSDGWFVFVDDDADGDFDSAADEVLASRAALPDSVTVSVTQPAVDDPDDPDDGGWEESDVAEFSYAASGFRSMPGGALAPNVSITFCDPRGNVQTSAGPGISSARMIEMSSIGRAAVSRDIDSVDERGGCPEE